MVDDDTDRHIQANINRKTTNRLRGVNLDHEVSEYINVEIIKVGMVT